MKVPQTDGASKKKKRKNNSACSRCHLPKVFPRDWVQLFRHGAVDAGLCSFPWCFQEHGEDGEEYRHESRVSGQVGVHRPRVDWVHCHIGTCEGKAPTLLWETFTLIKLPGI